MCMWVFHIQIDVYLFRCHAWPSCFFVCYCSFLIKCWFSIRHLPLVVRSIQMIMSWLHFFLGPLLLFSLSLLYFFSFFLFSCIDIRLFAARDIMSTRIFSRLLPLAHGYRYVDFWTLFRSWYCLCTLNEISLGSFLDHCFRNSMHFGQLFYFCGAYAHIFPWVFVPMDVTSISLLSNKILIFFLLEYSLNGFNSLNFHWGCIEFQSKIKHFNTIEFHNMFLCMQINCSNNKLHLFNVDTK